MLKRMLGLFLGLLLTFNFSVVAEASGDDPSSWAVEEIEAATEREMVPTEVMSAYQSNITRAEYVLIANQLIEMQDKTAEVTRMYPFSDILDHAYEQDIVLAFNAGIIEGDGNGKFRPNDFITRQEIATLVVNLVKYLDGVEELKVPVKYTYADIKDISNWALTNVHYCYNNNIMQGVGEDSKGRDIISPKGNATREQAIILLYRLSNSMGLFDTLNLGTIKLLDYEDFQMQGDEPTPVYSESEIINEFGKTFGQEVAVKLIELAKEDTINVLEMTKDYTLLSYGSEGKISVSKTGLYVDVNLTMFELPGQDVFDLYMEVVSMLHTSEIFESTVRRELNILTNEASYYFSEYLSDDEFVSVFSEERDNDQTYIIKYQYKVD